MVFWRLDEFEDLDLHRCVIASIFKLIFDCYCVNRIIRKPLLCVIYISHDIKSKVHVIWICNDIECQNYNTVIMSVTLFTEKQQISHPIAHIDKSSKKHSSGSTTNYPKIMIFFIIDIYFWPCDIKYIICYVKKKQTNTQYQKIKIQYKKLQWINHLSSVFRYLCTWWRTNAINKTKPLRL